MLKKLVFTIMASASLNDLYDNVSITYQSYLMLKWHAISFQVFLNVALEELGIILLRGQYHGLVQLLESFERMNRNIPFRKYRPSVPLKGNTSVWLVLFVPF